MHGSATLQSKGRAGSATAVISTTLMVTSSESSQTSKKPRPSSPKSFPASIVFKFRIHMFAKVLPPEFQEASKACQSHVAEDTLKRLPIVDPLIENCNSAGLEG